MGGRAGLGDGGYEAAGQQNGQGKNQMKSLPSGESDHLVEWGAFTPSTLQERSEVMFLCSLAEEAGQRAAAVML